MPDRSPGRRLPIIALAVIVAGAGALIVAMLWWKDSWPRPNTGVAAVEALASPTAAPSPTGGGPSAIATQAATLPTAAPTGNRPVRVEVDRLRIAAKVVPVGVDQAGDVVIPPSVDTVGWYRFGPGIGEPGSMVITGHVDSKVQGDGAFARLRDADPGDLVRVTGGDGQDTVFRVVGREEYPKATIDLDGYFATTGEPRLTLITCGGPFDSATGHYRDNVVVTAVAAKA